MTEDALSASLLKQIKDSHTPTHTPTFYVTQGLGSCLYEIIKSCLFFGIPLFPSKKRTHPQYITLLLLVIKSEFSPRAAPVVHKCKKKETILIAREIFACTLSSMKDSITLLNTEGGGGGGGDSPGIHYTNSPL